MRRSGLRSRTSHGGEGGMKGEGGGRRRRGREGGGGGCGAQAVGRRRGYLSCRPCESRSRTE